MSEAMRQQFGGRKVGMTWAVNIASTGEITVAQREGENNIPWEITPHLRLQIVEHSPYVQLSFGRVEGVTVYILDLQKALEQLLDKVREGVKP